MPAPLHFFLCILAAKCQGNIFAVFEAGLISWSLTVSGWMHFVVKGRIFFPCDMPESYSIVYVYHIWVSQSSCHCCCELSSNKHGNKIKLSSVDFHSDFAVSQLAYHGLYIGKVNIPWSRK